MGIRNFTLLLQSLECKPSKKASFYDAVLIDIQSLLYSKINENFDDADTVEAVVKRLCYDTCNELGTRLGKILKHEHANDLSVIISFDGVGVPMKWPLQRTRRSETSISTPKQFVLSSLFEHNTTSQRVCEFLVDRMSKPKFFKKMYFAGIDPFPERIEFLFSGSDMAGEGEHKLFDLAVGKKHVLVLSVDNDVFVISLCRRNCFETIQISKDGNSFYDAKSISVPESVIYSSFLFGNDFVPEIFWLTPSNVTDVVYVLRRLEGRHPVHVVHQFVKEMVSRGKIRFQEAENGMLLLVEFWKNVFWILDYYTKKEFVQKRIENRLYHMFARNALLTAMCDEKTMTTAFSVARREYDDVKTTAVKLSSGKNRVFPEKELAKINSFLLDAVVDGTATQVVWKRRNRD